MIPSTLRYRQTGCDKSDLINKPRSIGLSKGLNLNNETCESNGLINPQMAS